MKKVIIGKRTLIEEYVTSEKITSQKLIGELLKGTADLISRSVEIQYDKKNKVLHYKGV